MKLAGCPSLSLTSTTGTWYRALPPIHWTAPLATAHTATIPSRFSAAHPSQPGFEILYLTEHPIVAQFEIDALLGSPFGANVPNPNLFFAILTVRVRMGSIADLTLGTERQKIATSVQELTGDWQEYRYRSPYSPQDPFPPIVPTHKLGYDIVSRPTPGRLHHLFRKGAEPEESGYLP